MSDQYVSRAELDRLEDKIDRIDQGGTRGVGILAVQIQNLSNDFAQHELKHDQERSRQSTARRWMIATVIALIAAVDSPIVALWLAVRPHG